MFEAINTSIKHILIIRGGGIGDFILTLPVFSILREKFPQATITILGYPNVANLAVISGLADQLYPIESRELIPFFTRVEPLPSKGCNFFAKFALIISYLYDPDKVFIKNIRSCTQALILEGPHKPSDNHQTLHATQWFAMPLKNLGIQIPSPLYPQLQIPSNYCPTDNFFKTGPIIAIHPGSGSPTKNWPLENWVILLKHLRNFKSLRLCMIGGEADINQVHFLKRQWDPDLLKVYLCEPLEVVAGILKSCTLFIGHDSGISHLAAAVGTPSIIIWGPTNYNIWRPPHPYVIIIKSSEGLHGIRAEEVVCAIKTVLPSLY